MGKQNLRILISHPTGNANVKFLIKEIAEQGYLGRFSTTISVRPDSFLAKFLPGSVRSELLRRSFPVPPDKIVKRPLREAARLVLPRLKLSSMVSNASGWAGINRVYQDLDTATASWLKKNGLKEQITTVYAYEDGALETFRQAKIMGITCVYELPIAYWQTLRSLLHKEASRLPAWAVTLKGGIDDPEDKLARKTAELELADLVIVPSSFVADSLPAWFTKKAVMSPFGTPQLASLTKDGSGDPEKSVNEDRPLRVLFAGSMSQRKGLGDLFQAMKQPGRGKKVELVVLGSMLAPMEFYRSQYADFIYEHGRSHQQVLDLMKTCDVFCLPSIVEGRALVMQEAMSQGLPLIITPNTGGEDLVIEGETGFVVPVSSPASIAAKIQWFNENRGQVSRMGKNAMAHAATYTWNNYTGTILKAMLDEN